MAKMEVKGRGGRPTGSGSFIGRSCWACSSPVWSSSVLHLQQTDNISVGCHIPPHKRQVPPGILAKNTADLIIFRGPGTGKPPPCRPGVA
uniref:Uncharacterized protein n=1 Tax=Knipowitschia caucasica TaxID=637954 RepID=A0AAV2MQ92_KNICA